MRQLINIFRNSLNGTNQTEYKLNNIPFKLFPWEDKLPNEDKSLKKKVQKGRFHFAAQE